MPETAATLMALLLSKVISIQEFERLAETLSEREMALLLEELLRYQSDQKELKTD